MPGKHIQVIKAYDESLNQADTENLKLSIQLALDGFSFSIFNPENQKYLSIESQNLNPNNSTNDKLGKVLEALSEKEWMHRKYNSVNIFFEIPVVSLVPAPLFKAHEQETLSSFNFNIPTGNSLNSERLQNLDAYLLFHEPNNLVETLQPQFEKAIIQSHARVLVDSLLLINKNLSSNKRMFVNVRNGYLDILIIEGKQLLFYNIFHYVSKEDFIYFILFVMDQLDLSPEEISLQISGFINKKSALFDMAFRYVKNVDFVLPSNAFTYSHVFDDIPLHYYFNLFNSPLCVL